MDGRGVNAIFVHSVFLGGQRLKEKVEDENITVKRNSCTVLEKIRKSKV